MSEALSALDRVDLDGFDFHAEFLEPGDGAFDFCALSVEFEADEPDFLVHARLTEICDDLEFLHSSQMIGRVTSRVGYMSQRRDVSFAMWVRGVRVDREMFWEPWL